MGQPLMVKAPRTKIWDFTQVNSYCPCPNLEVAKIEIGVRIQNSPTKIHDMNVKGSKKALKLKVPKGFLTNKALPGDISMISEKVTTLLLAIETPKGAMAER